MQSPMPGLVLSVEGVNFIVNATSVKVVSTCIWVGGEATHVLSCKT